MEWDKQVRLGKPSKRLLGEQAHVKPQCVNKISNANPNGQFINPALMG